MIDRLLGEMATEGRGQVLQGVVLSIEDDGEAQTISVRTHDDVVRTGIEVMSIHGIATNPGDGALALLLAVGGDQSNLVALPLSNYATRFGGVPPGGAVLHDDAGNRLAFPADGSGLLNVALQLRLLAQTLLVQAQGGSRFEGPVVFTEPVEFQAPVTFKADVTIGGALHVTGAVTGASFNGRP